MYRNVRCYSQSKNIIIKKIFQFRKKIFPPLPGGRLQVPVVLVDDDEVALLHDASLDALQLVPPWTQKIGK